MRIVFFGTPDFAVKSLERLLESNHEITAVVTAPDKERGRGKKISFTAVKEFAVKNNIPVLQPALLKSEDFIGSLKSCKADLFVVVAFRILPEAVFTIPPQGSINLHGSLLPRYRGAAPIQWALINGEKETGLTTFFLKKKVDTGNIILQEKITIDPDDDLGSLWEKMSDKGAGLLKKTVDLIEAGNVKEIPQEDIKATPAPKISKEDCLLDYTMSVINVHNRVRGLSPHPGAFIEREGKKFKIYKTAIARGIKLKPGEVLQGKDGLFIGFANGVIEINELQPEGRKRMAAGDFMRGYKL